MKYFKKLFLPLILVSLCMPSVLGAATPVPSVWYTPSGAVVESEISLNALVYNDNTETVTYVVAFKTGEVTIGKSPAIAIASKSAKTISVKWTMPKDQKSVVVSVVSAKDTLKKEVPSMLGELGTINVGGIEEIKIPEMKKVKGFFGNILNTLEAFRLKQLKYFTNLKQKYQSVIGPNTPKDISDILKPESPGVPGTVGVTSDGRPANSHTTEYLTLVYASLGKSYFDHKALFYVTVILVVLFIIRAIFSRFF